MAEPRQEPKTISFLHQNFVRRFDREMVWKDTLESKAVAFLGFVGIFVTVLITVTTALSSPTSIDFLPLLAFPLILQVSSALLLFVVIFGYTVTVGPAVTDTFGARDHELSWVALGELVAYGGSTLRNRILLSRKVLWFQIAVLLAAASLVQLGLSAAMAAVDHARVSWLWVGHWIVWAPGLALALVASIILVRDYLRVDRVQREELNRWRGLLEQAREQYGREGQE
jgi:hypothetical protein